MDKELGVAIGVLALIILVGIALAKKEEVGISGITFEAI